MIDYSRNTEEKCILEYCLAKVHGCIKTADNLYIYWSAR